MGHFLDLRLTSQLCPDPGSREPRPFVQFRVQKQSCWEAVMGRGGQVSVTSVGRWAVIPFWKTLKSRDTGGRSVHWMRNSWRQRRSPGTCTPAGKIRLCVPFRVPCFPGQLSHAIFLPCKIVRHCEHWVFKQRRLWYEASTCTEGRYTHPHECF